MHSKKKKGMGNTRSIFARYVGGAEEEDPVYPKRYIDHE